MIIEIRTWPYINVKKLNIVLYKSYSNKSGMNIKVLEKQSNFISRISASPSKSEDLPTCIIENIQAIFKLSWIRLQWPKPKMFGKEDENGVSTPLVLSMTPYAHIIVKHAKNGTLSLHHSHLPFLESHMHNQASHTKQQHMFTNSTK